MHLPSGPILIEEADQVVRAIRSIRGVRDVEDRLERHHTAEGIPPLQGGRTRAGRRLALLQDSWSPTTKAMVALAGTAITAGLGYATIGGHPGSEPIYTDA